MLFSNAQFLKELEWVRAMADDNMCEAQEGNLAHNEDEMKALVEACDKVKYYVESGPTGLDGGEV